MLVVVTIPAYNEEKTIGKVISQVKKVMDNLPHKYKILVVDDGSKDKTSDVAKKAGAKVHRLPTNYSLAETFRTEMKQCLKENPDVIIHTDADAQYRAEDIPALLAKFEKGFDLVLGSRFKGKIESMPTIKRFGNKAFSRVISHIVRQRISDGQTGFRAFNQKVAKLDIQSNHTYTQEQIIKAAREKCSIAEVPVYFAKRKDKSRLMKSPFDYAIKAGVNILRVYRDYEPLKFFGFFGGFFIGIGLLLGLWILYTFLTTSFVGGIPRVILSALFIMTGVQILLFGFLADTHRK